MNKEEKEQWLYDAYQYTSNFDFNRLDKYEEANDDICIDDLILDYTMLYEFHKEEIEKLKERENMLQERFSDWKKEIEKERKYWLCERTDCCGRIKDSKKYSSLYQENKRLNNIINKISKMLEADTHCENIYYAIGVLLNKRFFDIKMVDNEELLNILGSDKE